MKSKELFVHNTSKRKTIEAFCYDIIEFSSVFSLAFFFKVEESGHLSGLMVSSKEHNALREIGLDSKKSEKNLNTKASSIDVISQE